MNIQVYAPADHPSSWIEHSVLTVLSFYSDNWPRDVYTPWQNFLVKVYGFLGKKYTPVHDLGNVKVFLTKEEIPGHAGLMGLCSDPHTVFVKLNGLQRTLGETALAHELMHLCLWQWRGFPDPDHSGAFYLGWNDSVDRLVTRADNLLRGHKL